MNIRSRVRVTKRSLGFFNLSTHSSRTMALDSTQPLAEMGSGGSIVVKALCYKPEGLWFETR
jgi:hypothetical protein